MMISLIALLNALPKALLAVVALVVYMVIMMLIIEFAHAWVRRAFFLCVAMLFPAMIIALVFLTRPGRPFDSFYLVMLGLAGFLILLHLPLVYAAWNLQPAALETPVPMSIRVRALMLREILIDLALVGCLFTVRFADIKGDMSWMSLLLIMAAVGANSLIHSRLKKRAGDG